MESEEMRELGVSDIGTVVTSSHMQWLHVPIVDGAIPDSRFDNAWSRVAPIVLQELRNGHKVVVNCRGGLGRTGMVACFLLVEMGVSSEQALKIVRAARPGTVETLEQGISYPTIRADFRFVWD